MATSSSETSAIFFQEKVFKADLAYDILGSIAQPFQLSFTETGQNTCLVNALEAVQRRAC
jgi:hypothetical protein